MGSEKITNIANFKQPICNSNFSVNEKWDIKISFNLLMNNYIIKRHHLQIQTAFCSEVRYSNGININYSPSDFVSCQQIWNLIWAFHNGHRSYSSVCDWIQQNFQNQYFIGNTKGGRKWDWCISLENLSCRNSVKFILIIIWNNSSIKKFRDLLISTF